MACESRLRPPIWSGCGSTLRGGRAGGDVEVFTGTVNAENRIVNTSDTPDNRFGLRAVVLSNGEPPLSPKHDKLDIPPDSFAKQSESLGEDHTRD